jgi:hypothetical protein
MFGSKIHEVLAMRDLVNESHASQGAILDQLRMKLFDAHKTKIYRKSAKEALGMLVAEIFEEIEGRKPVRLSDPKNTELRNEFYVDTMAINVKSHSSGIGPAPDGRRLEMSPETIAEFKAKRQIK